MKLEELRVWQESRILVREVIALVPAVHGIGIADQMRRAAVSIASNLAEGAGRVTDREVARFLVIARGSAAELGAQLAIAADCGCLPLNAAVLDRVDHVRRMLSALINRLEGSG
jgi:four helix bundle protein